MIFLEIMLVITFCDWCGVIEDATHYFFHCKIFERHVFNDTVRVFQPLTINLILFGNENWNAESNMVLFKAIRGYIYVITSSALSLNFISKQIHKHVYINTSTR